MTDRDTVAAMEAAILQTVLEKGGPILIEGIGVRAYVERGNLYLEYPDGFTISKSVELINVS